MNELTHYIGGKHVKGTSGRFADVFNPATGEVQAQVPLASADEMDQAIQIAAKAQVGWGAAGRWRPSRPAPWLQSRWPGPSRRLTLPAPVLVLLPLPA